jgi:MATE family multidrug resistance protein
MPDIKEAIFCIDRRAIDWDGVKGYLRLSVPSIVMLCLDWWVFEVMIVICGSFGVTDQAALIVVMNLATLMFRIAQGLEQASSSLIGKSIGMGSLYEAKQYYKLLTIVNIIFLCGLIASLYFSTYQ